MVTNLEEIEIGDKEEKVAMEKNWIDKRWPPRIFYGEKGQLMHPYTRM